MIEHHIYNSNLQKVEIIISIEPLAVRRLRCSTSVGFPPIFASYSATLSKHVRVVQDLFIFQGYSQ